jgi:hypothetical protein
MAQCEMLAPRTVCAVFLSVFLDQPKRMLGPELPTDEQLRAPLAAPTPTAPTAPAGGGLVEGEQGKAGGAVRGEGSGEQAAAAAAEEEEEEEKEGETDGEGGLPPIVDANTLIAVPRTVSEGPKGGPWSNTQRSTVRAQVQPYPNITLGLR